MLQSLRIFEAFRPTSLAGLGDTSTVQSQIVAAANQYGVDPNLALAVAKQESGYNQFSSNGSVLKSSVGAMGVMQLMPATAASLGVDPTDQTQNINGGVKLLSQLLTQFNGNASLALAAYNAGPGNVTKYGGVPPFAETQNYVSSIMANYTASGGANSAPVSSSDTSSSDGQSTSASTFDITDPTTWDTPEVAAVAVLAASVLYLLTSE